MNIIATIVPIFIVIFLGLVARVNGFISQSFLTQANRLVYFIAIPAMIFSAIAKSTLKTQMNLTVILICFAAVLLAAITAWGMAVTLKVKATAKGTFIQTSFHGNLGYIGLAVAFYYLGDAGFTAAAIIAGFVMILQNVMAVIVLTYHAQDRAGKTGVSDTIKKTMANPVILSALAGITFSLLSIPIPIIIQRALDILKGMALPMALLIIGASLSFEKLKPRFTKVIIASVIKIGLAPAIGYGLFTLFSISPEVFLPGLIMIAAPTATLTYILAGQLGGDPDFAVAAISISTLLSSITYMFWLGFA